MSQIVHIFAVLRDRRRWCCYVTRLMSLATASRCLDP